MLYIILFYLSKAIENDKKLSIIIGKALISNFQIKQSVNRPAQEGKRYLTKHDCKWLGDCEIGENEQKEIEEHECTCTPLRVLLRSNKKMTRTC